jgi:hypothetical protein
MSVTTIINRLPKPLLDELKREWLGSECWTDANQRTLKASHGLTMTTTGLTAMLRSRQAALLLFVSGLFAERSGASHFVLEFLRDIEVLRFVLELLAEEK